MTRFLKSGLAAAMLASAFTAAPALAQVEGEPAEAYVRYDDLDLSTERGMSLLQSRYRQAAQYACGMDIRPTGSHLARREARMCYAERLRNYDREVAAIVRSERRNA